MKKLQILFVACAMLFCALASYAAYDTLGATVTSDGTRFAIWNPDKITPANVWVQLPKDSNFTKYPLAEMTLTDLGVNNKAYTDVWGYVAPQNLDGCQYFFEFNGKVVRDPYARMTTGYVTDPSIITNNGKPTSDPTSQIRESQFVNSGTLENPEPATCPTGNKVPAVPGPCTQIVIDLNNPTYELKTLEDFNSNRPPLAQLTDAIVCEVNVRDYTTNPNSGISNGGTFTALAKSGTCNGQSTGLQHLKDLGVTHIQIMPMYTYSFTGYSYNWGYNPLEYNVPQEVFSTYFDANSTTPYSTSDYIGRIQELQNMVETYHKNGLRVVMDVVFNHTYAASVFTPNSPVSNAYYDTNNGVQTNYTGCGNTVNVTNPMVSNMVADSLAYWITVYGIDGYRFDEMAIFPYTDASSWAQCLNKLNPGQNYIYYGEPWSTYGLPDNDQDGCSSGNISCTEYMDNGVLTPGVGCFNGGYRNTLIGQNPSAPEYGGFLYNQFAPSNNMEQVGWGYNGSIRLSESSTDSPPKNLDNQWAYPYANMPSEAINYVSCHDGLCIWDKICSQMGTYDGQSESWSNQYLQQIDMFSAGIIMTSQGVAFFSEGDEFLRSKDGNANSYDLPLTVNWIDWSAKATNLNVFKYYKKLIALRKANPAFRQSTFTDITNNSQVFTIANPGKYPMPNGLLVGKLKDNSGNQFVVIYNSGSDYNYTIGSGSWKLLTNINDTGITSIKTGQYPAVGTVFTQGQNVLCCGTSVTVLANTANPQTPVVPSL